MQSIDMRPLDELDERFQKALRLWPSKREAVLKETGEVMRDMVAWNASNSGMKNDGGPVPPWQKYYVGTKNGYVAVRAAGGRDGGGVGKNSAGAITNYTENGHAIRRPSSMRKAGYTYRPRIKVVGVKGYHFYYLSQGMAQRAAAQAGEKLCQEAEDLIGGEAG